MHPGKLSRRKAFCLAALRPRMLPLLLLAACAWRATPAQTAPENPQQLAAAIDKHYNALHSLAVAFTESYDGMGMHRIERGSLLLAKGTSLHLPDSARTGRMRWTYSTPPGKLFVFDGRDAYFYEPGQAEVQRVPARQLGAEDDPRSPLALLLGHAHLAEQLAGIALAPAANGDATLSGVPRGLELRVARLSVTSSPEGVIHKLTVEEVDGARTDFEFTGEQPNAPAPGSAFVFSAPAGTHIVDGIAPM